MGAAQALAVTGVFVALGFWLQWLMGRLGLLRLARFMPLPVTQGFAAGVGLSLVLAQLTHAVTFAGHHAACIALVSRHFPGRLRGRGQALYTVVGYGLPGVIGGLGGGLLSSAFGLSSVFWLSAACAVVATGCAWRLRALK